MAGPVALDARCRQRRRARPDSARQAGPTPRRRAALRRADEPDRGPRSSGRAPTAARGPELPGDARPVRHRLRRREPRAGGRRTPVARGTCGQGDPSELRRWRGRRSRRPDAALRPARRSGCPLRGARLRGACRASTVRALRTPTRPRSRVSSGSPPTRPSPESSTWSASPGTGASCWSR